MKPICPLPFTNLPHMMKWYCGTGADTGFHGEGERGVGGILKGRKGYAPLVMG